MKLNVTRSNTALLALVRVALTCAVLAPTMDVAAQTPSSTTIEPVADGTVRLRLLVTTEIRKYCR